MTYTKLATIFLKIWYSVICFLFSLSRSQGTIISKKKGILHDNRTWCDCLCWFHPANFTRFGVLLWSVMLYEKKKRYVVLKAAASLHSPLTIQNINVSDVFPMLFIFSRLQSSTFLSHVISFFLPSARRATETTTSTTMPPMATTKLQLQQVGTDVCVVLTLTNLQRYNATIA